MQRIYISGAMRSGSSLVSGIINGHSKLKIVDNFHLQRFIIGKKEKLNKNIIYFKIKEMKARLGIRYGIQINDKKVIKNLIEKKKVSYKDVYNELILDQLDQNKSLEIIGEDAPMSWRFIEDFIKMYKKQARVIHLIRDPRSIFASWKKITYQNTNYWGCIFNLIDNMNYAKKLKFKLDKKNYLQVKFEDILRNPEKFAKIFCKFLGIKFEKEMIQPDLWPNIFKRKNIPLGWSSIGNKDVTGFYKNRIDIWKNHLNKGEIFIIEMLMKNQLIKNNYKLLKISEKNDLVKTELIKFLNCINESEYLKNSMNNFLKFNEGTNKFANNPSDPFTWGGGRKNKVKFVDTADGRKYLKILSALKRKYLKS